MGFIIFFGVVFIIVLAFKKDTTKTTITREDEHGNKITETHVTEHHSAAGTAARIVLIVLTILILLVVCMCSALVF